jgi:hypothetical protein
MTYLAKYDFFYFSRSLESCSSAFSEPILNFSQDLKSPVHALFAIYYDKFSLNQVFRAKKPCGFAYRADFAGSCVCHTDLGGGDSSYSSFPPTPGGTRPPLQFLFKQAISHGCGLIRPQICGRFSPHAVR